MVKEKKYVKVESEKAENNEVYGKDKQGRIIKIEQTGDPKKRATCKRIWSIVCWVIAIVFEAIGILKLTEVISWLDGLDITVFLIICIILDLIFVVIGSLLWKKANHIDPASEKNKTKFWLWNNLWTILSVIAFLPMIILIFTDKDLDKKSKWLVGTIAIVALAIAWLASYDWNPVSMEWLEQAQKEVLQVSPSGTVYWAEHSKKYHVDQNCPAFSRSETVYEGTVRDAYERWLSDPCRRCIPEYNWDEEIDGNDLVLIKSWDLKGIQEVEENEDEELWLEDLLWWLLEE